MTIRADVTVPAAAFVLGRVLSASPLATVRLTQLEPSGEVLTPYFWARSPDGGEKAFSAAVRDDPAVESLTRVDGIDGASLYRLEWADCEDPFMDALRTHDLVVESGTCTDETWTFRLRVADRQVLSSFHGDCRAQSVDVAVENVTDPGTAPAPFGLTERQRDALVVAYEAGYFDDPREASLTDVGERLGVSRQAMASLLDRAISRLVEGAVLPAIEEGAVARPGAEDARQTRR